MSYQPTPVYFIHRYWGILAVLTAEEYTCSKRKYIGDGKNYLTKSFQACTSYSNSSLTWVISVRGGKGKDILEQASWYRKGNLKISVTMIFIVCEMLLKFPKPRADLFLTNKEENLLRIFRDRMHAIWTLKIKKRGKNYEDFRMNFWNFTLLILFL
jgi:hypothetical protein